MELKTIKNMAAGEVEEVIKEFYGYYIHYLSAYNFKCECFGLPNNPLQCIPIFCSFQVCHFYDLLIVYNIFPSHFRSTILLPICFSISPILSILIIWPKQPIIIDLYNLLGVF